MKETFFLYCVVLQPTEEESKGGKRAVSIVPPTWALARGAGEVQLTAARAIPPEHADKLDRVEIHVRPF